MMSQVEQAVDKQTVKAYNKLRSLVSDRFQITIIDRDSRNHAVVSLSPCNGDFPWTHFHGKNINDALKRAIQKLEHPDEDYVELDGYVWKANESSVFDAEYTRGFLQPKLEDTE